MPIRFRTRSNDPLSGLQCGNTSVTANNEFSSAKNRARPISFNTRETYFRGPFEKATKFNFLGGLLLVLLVLLLLFLARMDSNISIHAGSGPPNIEKSNLVDQ